ncbi:Uncharacterised protein family SERF [Phaffia rhodozyma]|uniref:Uncharacterized protein family SERF n=1 Tax=Phaffia rhodozyma TaxID=264483 RepID=A0A0F7SEU2_PHARH|nr:Uncharacterised protein family SERF [Phaffia rhodozyma]
MARGNQRDKAREKNEKAKAAEKGKLTGNPQARREADAAALQAKIAAKQKAAAGIVDDKPAGPKSFIKPK